MTTLRTERLVLRPWRDEDLEPFAALNGDPRVMEHFPAPLTRAQSDEMAGRIRLRMADQGYGLWAVEVLGAAGFIGFVGLMIPTFEAHFTPCVEVGWRFAHAHWGHGFAGEGASAALTHAFGPLGLTEVVAMTVPANLRSRRVMEKLGMHRSESDDFDHPKLIEGHALRRHVLYRVTRADWEAR
jgi:ribosomal-protein-alanine N-acetyltransferase